MKLRRFVKAQVAGAFSEGDIRQNSPQLYNSVKSLSPEEIKKLLFSSNFIPLDMVALIYHANQNNFLQALRSHVMKYLRSNSTYKRWLEQMDLRPEDAASSIVAAMLNDDPNNRGVLNQVALDGSRADRYRYEREENSATANALRNSLQSTQNQIVVPFCPYCKAAGVEKPLWSFEVEDGKIVPKTGLEDGRCTTKEATNSEKSTDLAGEKLVTHGDIEVKRLEDGHFLVSKGDTHYKVALSESQKQELDDGLRFFTIDQDGLGFRCTFEAKIPSFSAFLGYSAIMAEMSKMWSSWQRQHGRTTDLKRFERLKELEEKASKEGLTPQEQKELRKERRYKERRDRAFIPNLTRLDAPMGTDDESRSRHESISIEDTDLSESEVRSAEFALEQLLDEDEIDLLDGLRTTGTSFLQAISDLTKYYQSGSPATKSTYDSTLKGLARFYIYGPENKNTERLCLTCGIELPDGAKSCKVALKAQKDAFDAYQGTNKMSDFDVLVQKFDPYVKKHYDSAQIRPIVDSLMFSGLEVDEDDIDLSFDDDFGTSPKLNFNDFKARTLAKLTPEQAAAFNGTNVQIEPEKSVQTEEISQDKIQEVAEKIDQLIRKVEEEDLLEELTVYFRA